ncbi:MAG: hypothetical protein ACLF0G_07250 [Candidatus Brocadiia bacterium]
MTAFRKPRRVVVALSALAAAWLLPACGTEESAGSRDGEQAADARPNPTVALLGDDAFYVPPGAVTLARVDVARLLASDFGRRLGREGLLSRLGLRGKLSGWRVDIEQVADVFAAESEASGPVLVARLATDLPLEEAVAIEGLSQERAGVRYAAARLDGKRVVVAKTQPRVLCFAEREDTLLRVIEQVSGEDAPELGESLRRAVERVCGRDHYVASAAPRSLPFARGADFAAAGLDVRSLISGEVFAHFPSEHDALAWEQEAEQGKARLCASLEEPEEAGGGPPGPLRRRLVELVRQVRVTRVGREVRLSAEWDVGPGLASVATITVAGRQLRDLFRVSAERLGGEGDQRIDPSITERAGGEAQKSLEDLKE